MSIFNGTADDIFNKKTDYPIGSICMFNTNIDPNEMYGGTWVRIKGKFILGADDNTYPLGSEGGEATHTLTVDEMPSHNHNFAVNMNESDHTEITDVISYDGWGARYNYSATKAVGGNASHNNMPPYVAFYIWAKVA